MSSLYEELSRRIEANPGLTRRNGARQDLGLLLFAEREGIDQLWKAAERALEGRGAGAGPEAEARLRAAVERLRPLFGERV